MTELPDYDAWARETPDSPAERGAAALTAALAYLIADTDEGCTLEQIILHGTYTDGRSGYAGTARRTITPDELREVLRERDDLAKKLDIALRTVTDLGAALDKANAGRDVAYAALGEVLTRLEALVADLRSRGHDAEQATA